MKKILITAPVRQDIKIFKEYLWSINRLNIPEGYEIHKFFYLHNSNHLKKLLQSNEYESITDDSILEYSDRTHIWKPDNFKAVSVMRSLALKKAREEDYNYIFSVDSDIILRKNSLKDLIENNKDVVGKIWWTAFDKNNPTNILPNCYNGRDTQGRLILNLTELKQEGLFEIGSICGCTLISNKIFNNEYINYYPIKNLSSSIWEDYAFSTRVHSIMPEVKFYINTFQPVKHLYRIEDYELWKTEKKQWEKEF